MENINYILEIIKYILQYLIYFDTKVLEFKVQSGGIAPAVIAAAKVVGPQVAASAAASAATPPPSAPAKGNDEKAKGKEAKGKGKNSGSSSNNGVGQSNIDEINKENFDNKKKEHDIFQGPILSQLVWAKDLFMSVLKWLINLAVKIVTTLLFASTAPIIPFFIVMSGMYAILKYFMYKLRKL